MTKKGKNSKLTRQIAQGIREAKSTKQQLWMLTRLQDLISTPLHAYKLAPLHFRTPTRFHAFTLTELLVAVAILAIMFTLLFIPMTQAFDNARRGRVMGELQNAANYALEIMVRELMQAVEVMPQERVNASNGQPLDLLDDASGDDDTFSRIDFVVRSVQNDRLMPFNWQQAYVVITYYIRRADPSRSFRYLNVGGQDANRRQIFRAQWMPDQNIAPEPNQINPQGRWVVTGAWIMSDLSGLPRANPPQGGLISFNALTPPDIDINDLRFTVERRPEQSLRDQKPLAVVVELVARKPAPGARARQGNPNETDIPSLFVRRRIKVVMKNVP